MTALFCGPKEEKAITDEQHHAWIVRCYRIINFVSKSLTQYIDYRSNNKVAFDVFAVFVFNPVKIEILGAYYAYLDPYLFDFDKTPRPIPLVEIKTA